MVQVISLFSLVNDRFKSGNGRIFAGIDSFSTLQDNVYLPFLIVFTDKNP